MNLDHIFLSSESLWRFMFCFFRVAPWLYLVPVLGYNQIPSRIRGLAAAFFSFSISPSVEIPSLPENFLACIPLLFHEMLAGCFLGLFIKVIFSSIELVGFLIGFQLNLNNASVFDPTSGTQNQLLQTFLSLGAIALLLELNMHHSLLEGLVNSYDWIPSKNYLSEMNQCLLKGMVSSLELCIRLSCPVIIIGALSYIMLGILSRILPGLHIFFVMMPGQILMIFVVLITILVPLFHVFCTYMDEMLKTVCA